MKKYVLLTIIGLLSISCSGQKNESKKTESKENNITEQPKGAWKVDKEFDDNGNLIRYDSIYSWSSNSKLNDLSNVDKDSLLQSFKSRFFTNFSGFESKGFNDIFSKDSLFSEHYFNNDFFRSDFGKDFMDIDRITQKMMEKQQRFLEKYQSEFSKPKDKNKQL
ncbi:hypothetical protein [Polaribacter butkevichii]|uniref:Lipoprotein n=1 Tax=Polaribacter butkevichii TaxID=218490 RepID=A0A2P6C8M6_9FLAO|nr:hypothetical protein [Polaribacter butkevichii]PQJ69270.1 hypothetical protein BTO14_14710 [Polaribacter butkevichii]